MRTRSGALLRAHEYIGLAPLPDGAEQGSEIDVTLVVPWGGREHRHTLSLPTEVPEGRHLHIVQVLPCEPRAVEEIDVQRGEDGQMLGALKAIY